MPGVILKVSIDVRGKTAWSKSTWYLPQLSELDEKTPRDVAIAQQWAGIVRYSPQSLFSRIPGYIANPDGQLPAAPSLCRWSAVEVHGRLLQ